MLKLFENLTSIITLNNQPISKKHPFTSVKGCFFIVFCHLYHRSSLIAASTAWS